jgi:MOSC domain-containing protein YiiM
MPELILEGTVVAVAADRGHHFSKPLRPSITLIEGHGVEGDAHAGPTVRHRYLARRRPHLPNLRQVHLLPSELFDDLRAAGYDLHPGQLGENVTTAGLDLERLCLGTLLRLGETAVIELTGLRTPCVLIDRFRAGLKGRMVRAGQIDPRFKCGVLGTVRAGGVVAAGDMVQATIPAGPQRVLPGI